MTSCKGSWMIRKSCSIEIFTVGNKNLIEKCCRAEAQFEQWDSRIWPWSCHQLQTERSTRRYGFCQHDLPHKTYSRQVLQNLPMLISNCPLGGLSPLIIFQASMESRLWRHRASCFGTVSRGCIRSGFIHGCTFFCWHLAAQSSPWWSSKLHLLGTHDPSLTTSYGHGEC